MPKTVSTVVKASSWVITIADFNKPKLLLTLSWISILFASLSLACCSWETSCFVMFSRFSIAAFFGDTERYLIWKLIKRTAGFLKLHRKNYAIVSPSFRKVASATIATALEKSRTIGRIAGNLSKLGLTIRGAYGEGSEPSGSLYQLSNQVTLGISEKAAIENLENITKQLVSQEQQARERLAKSIDIQDSVSRSLGLLKSAMVMTHDEALKLLSNVRFGILSGQIKDVTTEVVDSLMEKIEPATLMVNIQEKSFRTGR